MKLIKTLLRKRFQENCAFAFILFQIKDLCTFAVRDLVANSSLGPSSTLTGKEEKKKWASKESRALVWGGERVAGRPAAVSPSPVHRSARFPRRFVFPILPFLCAFFPHCGTWSRAILTADIVSCTISHGRN